MNRLVRIRAWNFVVGAIKFWRGLSQDILIFWSLALIKYFVYLLFKLLIYLGIGVRQGFVNPQLSALLHEVSVESLSVLFNFDFSLWKLPLKDFGSVIRICLIQANLLAHIFDFFDPFLPLLLLDFSLELDYTKLAHFFLKYVSLYLFFFKKPFLVILPLGFIQLLNFFALLQFQFECLIDFLLLLSLKHRLQLGFY